LRLAGGLQDQQLLEGAVMGTVQGAFVADDEGQALAVVGQSLKDPGEGAVVIHVLEFVVNILAAAHDFHAEQAGFNGADAAQAPAGDGHGIHQFPFDVALGLELLDVGLAERLESGFRLSAEDDALGAESMADAVLG
jgi:hypothetical protein